MEDVGYAGDGRAVNEILDGSYTFPEGCSAATIQLCTEAAKLYKKTSGTLMKTTVSMTDFQNWWKGANENISSSKSGAHFGHYKAAASCDALTALHVAKLNLVIKTGAPLSRWGHGMTVLLEKEFGAIHLDKLRAICLFEADFN